MLKYTFVAIPLEKEVTLIAEDFKQAHKMAWLSLTDGERDVCECLDWVDVDAKILQNNIITGF